MSLDLHHVPPDQLHHHWSRVAQGLTECLSSDPDSPWAEDVYAAIRYGHATLYVGTVRDQYVGFVVVQSSANGYGERHLHVWFVYGPGFLEQGLDEMKRIARQTGHAVLTFRPHRDVESRDAFGRMAHRLGFEAVETIYRMRVN